MNVSSPPGLGRVLGLRENWDLELVPRELTELMCRSQGSTWARMPKSSGLKGKSHLISPSKYTIRRLFYRNRFIEVPLHPAFMPKVPCNLVSGEHEKDGQGKGGGCVHTHLCPWWGPAPPAWRCRSSGWCPRVRSSRSSSCHRPTPATSHKPPSGWTRARAPHGQLDKTGPKRATHQHSLWCPLHSSVLFA